jgi:hypothetical protein
VPRLIAAAALAFASAVAILPAAAGAQNDLDAFMRQVLARQDDDWKKLQQYILDERERIELRGPVGTRLWNERREYTWYVRDGFFVRSPVNINGVEIGEADRRQYEADYLRRVQRRDRRGGGGPPADGTAQPGGEEPADLAGLIRQTRQPEFISSAYFLRFRFDEGSYAFVGRERLEGHEVLRIEYYPTNLFRGGRSRYGNDDGTNVALRRLMNKVALVTLWIEPTSHQIVKYTYDNVNLDFLPVPWLVNIEDAHATMTMGEMFPDVWLPRSIEMNVALTFALGPIDLEYALDYDNYRYADATIRIR